jgi:Holliday junction resolvase RusA-like endonuclease
VTTLAFAVPGKAVPKGRPRVFRGHAITPKRTRRYEELVAFHADAAVERLRDAGFTWGLDADAYRVTLIVFAGDKRHSDVDNLAKSLLDGCTGILWNDDYQVHDLRVVRALDRKDPRVFVLVSDTTRADLATTAVRIASTAPTDDRIAA